jgi:hypothetical protein
MEKWLFNYLVVLLSSNGKDEERFLLINKIVRIQDLTPNESSTH